MTAFLRRHRLKGLVVATLLAAPFVLHFAVDRLARPVPPRAATSALEARQHDGAWHAGKGASWVVGERSGHGVRVASLRGSPEELGTEHATLLRAQMAANEAVLWDGFSTLVPFAPARTLLFDVGRYRYRNVADGFPEARRRELAAEALAFTPDPYATHMPTYARMVFLHALYDISLSFEHSPLLGTGPAPTPHSGPRVDGCTAFGLGPSLTTSGHALFARAFDFEAAEVFDRDKAVFVVEEEGALPFASVAWPGLVGVVTGMNAEGVAVAVNGARAGTPKTSGMPVAFSLREVLSKAHDTREAIDILAAQDIMVSHIVFVGDAAGHFAVVERAPGTRAFVRSESAGTAPSRLGVTNHFEGPLATDPSNVSVRETSTTLQRRARLDELLATVPARSATVESTVAMLRDHRCAASIERDEARCPLGDRRTIDALIATHGVVFDLTDKTLWVSEGPHLSGRFVKIALGAIVSPDGDTRGARRDDVTGQDDIIAPDPVLFTDAYVAGRAHAGGPLFGTETSPSLPERKVAP